MQPETTPNILTPLSLLVTSTSEELCICYILLQICIFLSAEKTPLELGGMAHRDASYVTYD